MIDYERAKKESPALKAMLTRAQHRADAESRWVYVKNGCIRAVASWNEWGAWPDNWSRWQRALDWAYIELQQTPDRQLINKRPTYCPRLEEL